MTAVTIRVCCECMEFHGFYSDSESSKASNFKKHRKNTATKKKHVHLETFMNHLQHQKPQLIRKCGQTCLCTNVVSGNTKKNKRVVKLKWSRTNDHVVIFFFCDSTFAHERGFIPAGMVFRMVMNVLSSLCEETIKCEFAMKCDNKNLTLGTKVQKACFS